MLKLLLRALTCLIAFSLIVLGIIQLVSWWSPLSTEQWHLLGEVARNTNLLTVLAASTAAYIAWGTNRARTIEAKRSDFKDRVHWAVQHYTGGPTLESITAGKIIDQFAKDTELNPNDLALAAELAKQKTRIETAYRNKNKEIAKGLSSLYDKNLKLLAEIIEQGLEDKVPKEYLPSIGSSRSGLMLKLDISAMESGENETTETLLERYDRLDRLNEILERVLATEGGAHEHPAA